MVDPGLDQQGGDCQESEVFVLPSELPERADEVSQF